MRQSRLRVKHLDSALRKAFAFILLHGRKHDLATWTSRVIAIESGCHLDVFDFAGAERIAEEAREQARSSNYIGPVVSAGIDLLFNYARRREPAARIRPHTSR